LIKNTLKLNNTPVRIKIHSDKSLTITAKTDLGEFSGIISSVDLIICNKHAGSFGKFCCDISASGITSLEVEDPKLHEILYKVNCFVYIGRLIKQQAVKQDGYLDMDKVKYVLNSQLNEEI
jgi:hypothetical protein